MDRAEGPNEDHKGDHMLENLPDEERLSLQKRRLRRDLITVV